MPPCNFCYNYETTPCVNFENAHLLTHATVAMYVFSVVWLFFLCNTLTSSDKPMNIEYDENTMG